MEKLIINKMKKVKFEGKLSLNKETITKLNNEQMANVNGGGTKSFEQTCGNMSNLGPCYTLGTFCLPETESCNVNSCPAMGSCPTRCTD
ncbi:MAG: class I lanthipeptide [Bacteroidetes bacterium]|nr:class I lanthipeptide [Bacteroidota bacterium]